MPAKKKKVLRTPTDRIKEVNRLIRLARTHWKAHNNSACRRERSRALTLYEGLSPKEKEKIPQTLRVWLRYRSEKYFGSGRRGSGANSKG